MGDGLKVNRSLWSPHFPHYTPITDIMHALSYVYCAAITSCGRIEDGWTLYLQWLSWVWSGRVDLVIAAMKKLAAEQDEVCKPLRRGLPTSATTASE